MVRPSAKARRISGGRWSRIHGTSILEFLAFCRNRVRNRIAALDLTAESGFSWLPFGPVERLAYNLRHLQHHTGQLSERIRQDTGNGVRWVGRG